MENISDKTKILFTHEPCSVVYYLISPWSEMYKCFSGRGCVKNFVDEIFEIENKAIEYFKTNLKINISNEEEIDFQNSKECWLCDKKFLECEFQKCECENDKCECKKVRDHDHLTGKYRGAAHKNCNLQAKQQKSNFVPVLFHNFQDMIVI